MLWLENHWRTSGFLWASRKGYTRLFSLHLFICKCRSLHQPLKRWWCNLSVAMSHFCCDGYRNAPCAWTNGKLSRVTAAKVSPDEPESEARTHRGLILGVCHAYKRVQKSSGKSYTRFSVVHLANTLLSCCVQKDCKPPVACWWDTPLLSFVPCLHKNHFIRFSLIQFKHIRRKRQIWSI